MNNAKESWRLIVDMQPNSAAMNMAIDEAILQSHKLLQTPPTLRLYQWQKPTLSIGYFQKIDRDVDLQKLKSNGMELVRRSTGGRAVLHHQELTYSVVLGEDYPQMPKGVTESYLYLSQGLVKALEYLDIPCELVLKTEKTKNLSPACFHTPSQYELLVQGKKIIGSAQVRKNSTILQHGSIPLELNTDLLFSVLRFRNDSIQERMKQKFTEKAIAINEANKRDYAIAEIQEAVIDGFSEALSVEIETGCLMPEEIALAEDLVKNKFESYEWNFSK
jgi:lipoate-protein ligase A